MIASTDARTLIIVDFIVFFSLLKNFSGVSAGYFYESIYMIALSLSLVKQFVIFSHQTRYFRHYV